MFESLESARMRILEASSLLGGDFHYHFMKAANRKVKPVIKKPTPTGNRPKSDPMRQRPRDIPEVDLGMTIDLTFRFSAKHPPRDGDIVIKGSKSFPDTPPKNHLKLFQHKCAECSKICDFESDEKDSKAKVTKTQLLKHLVAVFSLQNVVKLLTPEAMKEFYDMIGKNIFRHLPVNPILGPLDVQDTVLDTAWPHIELCYQALSGSLMCPHADKISQNFIYNLIRNGTSLDDRERAAVKDALYAIYVRYMNLRLVIRRACFSHFAMAECSNELLEFFVTVINGFNTPLKKDHLALYNQAFLYLHTHEHFVQMYEHYMTCTHKLITKGPELLHNTIKYILSHWPVAERIKQIYFLKEIHDFLQTYKNQFTPDVARDAYRVVALGVYNENSEVADQAFEIITDTKIVEILIKFSNVVYPILFENLCKSGQKHWDENIKTNAFVALQVLRECDAEEFKKMNEARGKLKQTITQTQMIKTTNWGSVLERAKSNFPDLDHSQINFDHILKFPV